MLGPLAPLFFGEGRVCSLSAWEPIVLVSLSREE